MKPSLKARLAECGISALLIALAQVPFWMMQTRVEIQRPLVNLDLIVAILIMRLHRGLGLVALCVAWLVEINQDVSASYRFVGAADLVDAVRFLDLIKLHLVVSWTLALALGVFVLCALALRWLAARPASSASALVLLGVLLFVSDGVNGSNRSFGLSRDRFLVDSNIAGSPSIVTMRKLRAEWAAASVPIGRMPDPATYRRALAWHDVHPQSTILLVLVESMGLPQSEVLRDWLTAQLDTAEIERRWRVQRVAEAFHGPTVYGELRVLCGLNGHYSRLTAVDESECLPRRVLRSGGQALGLHGFNMRMFDRARWWRDMGLTPQDFSEDALRPGEMHCNDAFPGVCDGAVLRRAAELADQPSRLVYVVTLDTHLPLPAHDMTLSAELAASCTAAHASRDGCQMIVRQAWVLHQLEASLAGMAHPPLVLVSGDHAPPFLDTETRAEFDPSHVLGFVLEPR